MQLHTAYKKIAQLDEFEDRCKKLDEEREEVSEAIFEYSVDDSVINRKLLIEELADLSVCIEILVEKLDGREGFEAMKHFKTYREVCRRWLGDAEWCATNPKEEAV